MAVNVELRDESGCVLAQAGGDGLIEHLGEAAAPTSPCLRWIDPYGDTILNSAQSAALVGELRAARAAAADGERASLDRLIELAQACADGVDLYVWCIGD